MARSRSRRPVCPTARALLEDGARLVTLTGPGGSGKTRLAIELGHRLAPDFEAGAAFVPLAPVRSPELVVPAIVQALGFIVQSDAPLLDVLKRYLAPKSMLLVLDNLEHVLDAAPVVAELLESSPGLRVVATSRSPLRLRGEHQLAVPPLPLPAPDEGAAPADPSSFPAVALFLERAAAVDPGFRLTDANAAAVVAICRRLDGLPLAIELAAGRLSLLTPAALLERLEASVNVLVSGPRDLPARQRTLRDTIRWSYDLLEVDEQALFRSLAVFVGGDLDAVEAVAAGAERAGAADAIERLDALVTGNLADRYDGVGQRPRFRLLETIREFALSLIEESGEDDALREAHAGHFLRFAREAEPHIEREDQFLWLVRLEEEHGNLRAALKWLDARGDAERLLLLAGALWRFWWVHAHVAEARGWLGRAESETGAPPRVRARALVAAANLAAFQAELDRARALGEAGLALYRHLSDGPGIAMAAGTLGKVALLAGELDAATGLLEECLQRARSAGDRWIAARALNDLGEVARLKGELPRAGRRYRESLATGRDLGTQQTASTYYNLGAMELMEGDHEAAGRLLSEGFALACRLGDMRGIANGMEYLAGVWAAAGEHARAARLLGRAGALRESIDVPLESADQAPYDHAVALARAGLASAEFEQSRLAGRRLTLEQARVEAMVPAASSRPEPSAAGSQG
jgi:predicted ATPase